LFEKFTFSIRLAAPYSRWDVLIAANLAFAESHFYLAYAKVILTVLKKRLSDNRSVFPNKYTRLFEFTSI